jgi:hypothetical protein
MHSNRRGVDQRLTAKPALAMIAIVWLLLSIGSIKLRMAGDHQYMQCSDERHDSGTAGAGCIATKKLPLFRLRLPAQ